MTTKNYLLENFTVLLGGFFLLSLSIVLIRHGMESDGMFLGYTAFALMGCGFLLENISGSVIAPVASAVARVFLLLVFILSPPVIDLMLGSDIMNTDGVWLIGVMSKVMPVLVASLTLLIAFSLVRKAASKLLADTK